MSKMDEIINLQNHHECYFNWIDKNFDKVAAEERIVKRQCLKKCADTCEFCCLYGDWRLHVEPSLFLEGEDDEENGYFHKFVCWNGEMVFLEAFTGQYLRAENRLNYVNSAIEGTAKQSYLDGYKYICNTLQAYIKTRRSSMGRFELGLLEGFNGLSPQSQISVLSVKLKFYKETNDTFDTQIKILRKLTELEPSNPVWYEALGLRLRLGKKEGLKYGHPIKASSQEEMKAFAKAYNMRPDVPKFFASLSRSIAEKLKHGRYSSDQAVKFDFDVQNQTIETVADAVYFMKKYTRLLLEAADTFGSGNDAAKNVTTMGEVFSVSLPLKFLDFDLAEECITTAIRISPTCSKANHRMGLFQLFKRNDFESALEYLTAAVGCKNENYYALIDWLSCLMREAEKKSEILTEIFEQVFSKNFSWTPFQKARLRFLNGCFLLIVKGNKKETMSSMVHAYEIDGKTCHFLMTFREAMRFKWKHFEQKAILHFLTGSKLCKTPMVEKMIAEVRKCLKFSK